MKATRHPIVAATSEAMASAILYHEDPVATVVAQRWATLQARWLDDKAMVAFYGPQWEAVMGVFRFAETLTPSDADELARGLTLRMRRLLRIAEKWLAEVQDPGILPDATEDAARLLPMSEPTRTVLSCSLAASMLHPLIDGTGPVTYEDELELQGPVLRMMQRRGKL